MTPIVVLVTAAVLGVEAGWEPLADGGHEYTIQIEPELVDLLKRGHDEIYSEVPPDVHVRRYRIIVGNGKLLRDAGEARPAAVAPADEGARRGTAPAAVQQEPLNTAPTPAPGPTWAEDPEPSPGPHDNPFGSPSPVAEPRESAPLDFGTPPSDEPDAVEPAPANERQPIAARVDPPGEAPPARLRSDVGAAGPIQATYDARSQQEAAGAGTVETQKPELPKTESRPWLPLVGAVALLCCSLGANVFLGWVAWGQRHRYREAVTRLRPAA